MKYSSVSKVLAYLSILLLVCDPTFVHSLSIARGVIAAVVILSFVSMFCVYRASSKNEITDSGALGVVGIDIVIIFFSAVLLFVTFWSEHPGSM
ncbi:hypothetical protein KGP36_03700 [Patescibacteria group bacterium]|nr:hypothetical protein [Patescibacteria group bacterium]MDE1940579.1 hypothetical protein [Patescibacteria group bacterium]